VGYGDTKIKIRKNRAKFYLCYRSSDSSHGKIVYSSNEGTENNKIARCKRSISSIQFLLDI